MLIRLICKERFKLERVESGEMKMDFGLQTEDWSANYSVFAISDWLTAKTIEIVLLPIKNTAVSSNFQASETSIFF